MSKVQMRVAILCPDMSGLVLWTLDFALLTLNQTHT
jgi:hypothetical protein